MSLPYSSSNPALSEEKKQECRDAGKAIKILLERDIKPSDIMKTFGLFLAVGAAHWVFRKQFLAISVDPEKATADGLKVRWWDFLFYMLFGLVVTSFVHIGGVLLIFSYLVVPAVCATYIANSIVVRFAIGWVIATFCSIISLFITAQIDF